MSRVYCDWWPNKPDLDTRPGWAMIAAQPDIWEKINADQILALEIIEDYNNVKNRWTINIYTHSSFFSELAVNFGTISDHCTQFRVVILARRWSDCSAEGSGLWSARPNRFCPAVFESRRTARLVSGARTSVLQLIRHLFRKEENDFYFQEHDWLWHAPSALALFLLENLAAWWRPG